MKDNSFLSFSLFFYFFFNFFIFWGALCPGPPGARAPGLCPECTGLCTALGLFHDALMQVCSLATSMLQVC